jgi:hypothetical protein
MRENEFQIRRPETQRLLCAHGPKCRNATPISAIVTRLPIPFSKNLFKSGTYL